MKIVANYSINLVKLFRDSYSWSRVNKRNSLNTDLLSSNDSINQISFVSLSMAYTIVSP